MSQGTVIWKGKSGKTYEFEVWGKNTTWNEVACVYTVTRKLADGRYGCIYIGETDNMRNRFSGHENESCFDRHNWTHVCTYRENNSDERLRIEADILANYNWPCNG